MKRKMNVAVIFVHLSAVTIFAQPSNFIAYWKSDTTQLEHSSQLQFNSRTPNSSQADTDKEDKIGPLKILSKPTAQFTDEARKNGTTGFVRLRVTFLASGSIGEISAVDTLPDGLTESAIEAAKGIRFKPATKNGEPMTVTKLVEYSFAK